MFKLKELRGKKTKTKTGKTGTLEQAAQGNAGVTAPEVLKKSTDVVLRDMAQWAMLMVGGWVDKMILEVISNINDSRILW